MIELHILISMWLKENHHKQVVIPYDGHNDIHIITDTRVSIGLGYISVVIMDNGVYSAKGAAINNQGNINCNAQFVPSSYVSASDPDFFKKLTFIMEVVDPSSELAWV